MGGWRWRRQSAAGAEPEQAPEQGVIAAGLLCCRCGRLVQFHRTEQAFFALPIERLMAGQQGVELLAGTLMQFQHQLQDVGCGGGVRAGGQPLFCADLVRQPPPPPVIAFGSSGLQLASIDRLQVKAHAIR